MSAVPLIAAGVGNSWCAPERLQGDRDCEFKVCRRQAADAAKRLRLTPPGLFPPSLGDQSLQQRVCTPRHRESPRFPAQSPTRTQAILRGRSAPANSTVDRYESLSLRSLKSTFFLRSMSCASLAASAAAWSSFAAVKNPNSLSTFLRRPFAPAPTEATASSPAATMPIGPVGMAAGTASRFPRSGKHPESRLHRSPWSPFSAPTPYHR